MSGKSPRTKRARDETSEDRVSTRQTKKVKYSDFTPLVDLREPDSK